MEVVELLRKLDVRRRVGIVERLLATWRSAGDEQLLRYAPVPWHGMELMLNLRSVVGVYWRGFASEGELRSEVDVVTPRVEPADEFPEARVAGSGDEEDIRRGGSVQRPERDVDNHRLQNCRLRSRLLAREDAVL